MDSLTLFCAASLLAGGIYWFVCVLGSAEQKGKHAVQLSGGSIDKEKVQDKYKQYWSFFRRPKEIETAEKVPAFVDTFYNLVTDIYEWGWGQSFHFSPSIPGKSHRDATRITPTVDLLGVKKGARILDGADSIEATCHAPKLEDGQDCVLEESHFGHRSSLAWDCPQRCC